MRNVGFCGGALTVELGTVNDMVLFFECIKSLVSWKYPEMDWSLLTDRFYKRYLRLEEMDISKELMDKVHQLFMEIPSSSITWEREMEHNHETSKLNPDLSMISDVFSHYFSAFSECSESAIVMYDEFKSYPGYEYEPIRIVLTEMPENLEDYHRPLEQYDALGPNDSPFWLR